LDVGDVLHEWMMAARKLAAADSHKTTAAKELPAAELTSFLRDYGAGTWTERDFAACLRIGATQAKEAMSILQLEGYIERAGTTAKWQTTDAGRTVAGAKTPRFTRASIEAALNTLRDRIHAVNTDPNAMYSVSNAVAFGDFLRELPRVQAASVGIALESRKSEPPSVRAKNMKATLNQLRGGSAMLNVQPYEPWMSARWHRDLL
jgi:hypothetical protein